MRNCESFMLTDLNGLFQLTKKHVKPAAQMLARAFIHEPYEVYLTPDESKRIKRLTHVFTFLMKYNILYGVAYATSPNLEGVAGWLHSRNALDSYWKVIRSGAIGLLFKVGITYARQQLALQNLFTEKEKINAPFPHWYLVPLGVDPQYQGNGYASKLLRPTLAWLDTEQLPCYLETELEKNVEIYEHFGFEIVEKGTILDTDVPFWCMLRKNQ